MTKPIQVRGREGHWFAHVATQQARGPYRTVDEAILAARGRGQPLANDATFDRVRTILRRLISSIDPRSPLDRGKPTYS